MLLIQMLIGNMEYKLIKSIRSTPLNIDKTRQKAWTDINTKIELHIKFETKGDFKFRFSPCKTKQKKIIVQMVGKIQFETFKGVKLSVFPPSTKKKKALVQNRMYQIWWGMIFKEDILNGQEINDLKF
ncbi:hypothetical protein ABPG74_020728 [Tetrahymena malaccensis]